MKSNVSQQLTNGFEESNRQKWFLNINMTCKQISYYKYFCSQTVKKKICKEYDLINFL